jgi:hypothetical protein
VGACGGRVPALRAGTSFNGIKKLGEVEEEFFMIDRRSTLVLFGPP